ncbi:hypothetical protein HCJ58_04995 [Listeria sp. FSL L7-1509]|uniref:Uncharacterized protein n=1 Tax=Listeria immobilis TaxID=2713502 RepID=A0ABR6SUT6_9LIST|nr:hypothetical protein [Listeria immobilis]MBC1506332.1 hypothetical protein [Listeria immobilis]MBC1509387.1 hypothetical protein [Listeria immobilis]MBC6304519.1 hypothetical protein [Listeria immobilis]MBC6312078.1 hypothetical protein [Listeria immobilis]
MAYKNAEIVVSSSDGKIYLCTLDRDGFISDTRKEITSSVLRATAEYFKSNEYKMAHFSETEDKKIPKLFFTEDSVLAEKILNLLQNET